MAVHIGVAPGPGRAQANPPAYVRMRSPDLTADIVRLFRDTWQTAEERPPPKGPPAS